MSQLFLILPIISFLGCHADEQTGSDAFPGPRPENLVGYLALDSSETGHGFGTKFPLSSYVELKLNRNVDPGPGPFNVYATSSVPAKPNAFLADMKCSDKDCPTSNQFTIAFFYYPSDKKATSILFRIGNPAGKTYFDFVVNEKNKLSVKNVGDDRKMVFENVPILAKTWQFLAVTYDSRNIVVYRDFGPVIFANNNFKSLAPFEAKISVGQLRAGDKMACFTAYHVTLTQLELGFLPNVCYENDRFGMKRFYGSQAMNLVGFFPLDVEASLSELTSGLVPKKLSASNAKSGGYLVPATNQAFVAEFKDQLLARKTLDATVTFYIFCSKSPDDKEVVQLLDWDTKLVLKISQCSKLDLTILPDKKTVSIAVDLTVGKWEFVGLTYSSSDGNINLYKYGKKFEGPTLVNKGMPFKIDKATSGPGNVAIGPNRIGSIGISCLGLYNTTFSFDDMKMAKCYCPAYGRHDSVIPSFMIDTPCSDDGANRLAPGMLSDSLLCVLFDDETGFDNTGSLRRNYGRIKEIQLERRQLGPFLEEATCYVVNGSAKVIATYDKIPSIINDFTVSFFFFRSNEASNRRIVQIKQTTSGVLLEIFVHGNEFVVRNGEKDVASVELIKDSFSQWSFFAFSYEGNRLVIYRRSGDILTEVVGEGESPLFSGAPDLDLDTANVTIGELQRGDRIACLFVDARALSNSEIARLSCACRTRGHCPDGRPLMPRRIPKLSSGPEKPDQQPVFALLFDKDNGLFDVINGSHANAVSNEARLETVLEGPDGAVATSYRNVEPQEGEQLSKMASYFVNHGLTDGFSLSFYLNITRNSQGGEVASFKPKSGDKLIARVAYTKQNFEVVTPKLLGIFPINTSEPWTFFGVSFNRKNGTFQAFDVDGYRITPSEIRSMSSESTSEGRKRHRRQESGHDEGVVTLLVGKLHPGDRIAMFKLFNVLLDVNFNPKPPKTLLRNEASNVSINPPTGSRESDAILSTKPTVPANLKDDSSSNIVSEMPTTVAIETSTLVNTDETSSSTVTLTVTAQNETTSPNNVKTSTSPTNTTITAIQTTRGKSTTKVAPKRGKATVFTMCAELVLVCVVIATTAEHLITKTN